MPNMKKTAFLRSFILNTFTITSDYTCPSNTLVTQSSKVHRSRLHIFQAIAPISPAPNNETFTGYISIGSATQLRNAPNRLTASQY